MFTENFVHGVAKQVAEVVTKWSDEKILELAQKYGTQTRLWRQKFTGLLPEVERRKLYEKKGYKDIFVFAAKLCGLSKEQVKRTLNLDKKFEDKPVLKSALENGEISVNKLARVASIATTENQEFLVEKAKILPQKALEIFVKDQKILDANGGDDKNQNGLQKPLFDLKSVRAHNLNLDEDVEKELLELQQKGIDINEMLRGMLAARRQEIENEKNQISASISVSQSRYIPVKIKKVIIKEYGTKCAMPNCEKRAEEIDHIIPFALSQNHDPRNLRQLCKEHHIIAHSIDVSFHEIRRRT